MYNVGYTKLIVPVYMEYTDPEYLGDGKVGYKDLCDWNADGYNSDGGNATAHNGDMCKSIMLLHEGKWNKVEYSLRRILAEIEKSGKSMAKTKRIGKAVVSYATECSLKSVLTIDTIKK